MKTLIMIIVLSGFCIAGGIIGTKEPSCLEYITLKTIDVEYTIPLNPGEIIDFTFIEPIYFLRVEIPE